MALKESNMERRKTDQRQTLTLEPWDSPKGRKQPGHLDNYSSLPNSFKCLFNYYSKIFFYLSSNALILKGISLVFLAYGSADITDISCFF